MLSPTDCARARGGCTLPLHWCSCYSSVNLLVQPRGRIPQANNNATYYYSSSA